MSPGLPGWLKEAVARYRIEMGTDPPRPLTLHPEPVLRWTNPSAGRVYGDTYVWLQQGRPAAAGSMYRYFEPFQSFNGELAALARVQRLRAGFALNYAAIGLVADLLDRIAVLEAALRGAQRRGR